jgi:DnaK suppressor protein
MGEKAKLLKNAQRTLTEDMTLDQDDLPDEMDLATADYNQSLAFRLRGRERHLLSKIDDSLERIEIDEYFWCSSCSIFIGLNRLLARPVTTLCIRCKEKQERQERSFAG